MSGKNNKEKDKLLIAQIKEVLEIRKTLLDEKLEVIRGYVERYDDICSLTDKMRYTIRKYLDTCH